MRLVSKIDHEAESFAALKATAASLVIVGEAAQMLGLSPDMVRVLARQGTIKSARIGTGKHGLRVFVRTDIEALVRLRAVRAAAIRAARNMETDEHGY